MMANYRNATMVPESYSASICEDAAKYETNSVGLGNERIRFSARTTPTSISKSTKPPTL